jgi:hypothetical protein
MTTPRLEEYRLDADAPAELLTHPGAADRLAAWLMPRVLRNDLVHPGFALLDLGPHDDPVGLRAFLVALAAALDRVYLQDHGRRLLPLSLSRFDQQTSTGAHRDGGPDESVLILGYEPTTVDSRVFLLDHTRCAFDRGLTPAAFLEQHHPVFGEGRELLRNYTTELEGFDSRRALVLVVNNSNRPFEERARGTLGVLHQAIIATPRPGAARVINSLLLAAADAHAHGFTAGEVEDFVATGAAAAR